MATETIELGEFDDDVVAIVTPSGTSLVGDYEGKPDNVSERIGSFYENESGSMYRLLGDFKGFAVLRCIHRDADREAADEIDRVYLREWPRFAETLSLLGVPDE